MARPPHDDFPYPRDWSQMAVDFKLMFGFHITMMVLMVAGGRVAIPVELTIAGLVLVGALIIATMARFRAGWRWPGAGLKELAIAALGVALVGVFAFSMTPLMLPLTSSGLPWMMAVGAIGLFGLLKALRLASLSQAEFLAQCGDPQVVSHARVVQGPAWKRVVATAYSTAFVCIWLVGVASFYFHGRGMRDGAAAPQGDRTLPLVNHGQTVFVSPHDMQIISTLQTAMFVGIPIVMMIGVVLHFGLGIKVFGPNTKT